MLAEDGAHEDEGDDDAEEDGVADGVAGEGHAAQEQEGAEQGAGNGDEAADDGGGVWLPRGWGLRRKALRSSRAMKLRRRFMMSSSS